MKRTLQDIQNVYLLLTLCNTLAASFIWGINTLFLLNAGLSNVEAFAANAFFTIGEVIFEVPTGIIADSLGRRTSYLFGTITLAISTLLYLYAWTIHSPFWVWAATSILLGLGFTFFSGATEAWLVDALQFTGSKKTLESVFAKGQIVGGIAMLIGSVSGGLIAQTTNLGVPYILRSIVLGINFFVAFFLMKDLGFTPSRSKSMLHDIQNILTLSVHRGFKNPPVRWVMLAAPFSTGVSFFAFYAMQPYLLKLYGNEKAYGIAGLAAAIIAGAQIVGGFIVPYIRKNFHRRTSVMLMSIILNTILLICIGFTTNFVIAVVLLIIWGLISAAVTPIRQAYLNELIPSSERATVLSFDSLISSSGGVVVQPLLGKVADASGYASSYLVGSVFQIIALPFILLAQREHVKADIIV